MYVILGGAHNGKRAFVEKLVAQFPQKERIIFEGKLPSDEKMTKNKQVIISNLEQIIFPHIHENEDEIAMQIFNEIKKISLESEVYCICTDTSRGVVPLEKEARQLRDTCGRLYQKLCQEANTVVRVWYGIPQYLKGEQNGKN